MLGISLHAILDPSPSLGSLLVHFRLVLQKVFDGVRRGHMATFLNTFPRSQALLPRLQIGELIDVHARPAGGRNPPPVRDIGNGDVVANQVARLGSGEMLVQHTIQATGLIDVSVHAVLDALGSVAREMVCLALHGTDTGIHEVQPADSLVVLASTLGVGDLVVFVILFRQVSQDAAGLEQTDLLAIGEGVGQGGDTAIGVNFEEPPVRRQNK